MRDWRTLKGLLEMVYKADDKLDWLAVFFAQLGVARTTGCALGVALGVALVIYLLAT